MMIRCLTAMRDAGFHTVFLGIETPVEESLKEAQKTQNRGNLLESVKKIQSYGMEVMGGFIVGFDNDPEDIFQRQINFIRDSAIPFAMVGLLTALPDTQLWRRLKHEGRLLAESNGNNTSESTQFHSKDGSESARRRLSFCCGNDLQLERVLSTSVGVFAESIRDTAGANAILGRERV